MREEGLQWAWNKGLVPLADAYTRESIKINNRGTWNRFSPGPDFKNASIRIGNITWYGDVEIHVKASDWFKHKHHLDPNYQNVILHVVMENDKPLAIHGERIPTIIMPSPLIKYLTHWQKKPKQVLPCSFTAYEFTPNFLKAFWRKRMNRKHLEFSAEKEIAAYLLGSGLEIPVFKYSGRQRHWTQKQTAVLRLKQVLHLDTNTPVVMQLDTLEKTMRGCLTPFETQSILLNGLLPLLWNGQNEPYIYHFSQKLPPENNHLTRLYHGIIPPPRNAFETQALLEINRELCNTYSCLTCELGCKILCP
jgi:hypothetical protein